MPISEFLDDIFGSRSPEEVSRLLLLWGMSFGAGSSRQRLHDRGGPAEGRRCKGAGSPSWDRHHDGAEGRKRETTAERPMEPVEPRSTTLGLEQEAVVAALRRHTLPPLDDCLYALQPSIPGLPRSSLHRCLRRHGISRLPDLEGDRPAKTRFKVCPIGFVRMDIAEVRTGEGRLYLLAALDRTSKFAVARLHDEATRPTACRLLEPLLEAVPCRIHALLPDSGIQSAEQPGNRSPLLSRQSRCDATCAANEVEHRLAKPNHPWANGQVERTNRTIRTPPPDALATAASNCSTATLSSSSTPAATPGA